MCLLTVLTLEINRLRGNAMCEAQPSYILKKTTILRMHKKDSANFTVWILLCFQWSIVFYELSSGKWVHFNTLYLWKHGSFCAWLNTSVKSPKCCSLWKYIWLYKMSSCQKQLTKISDFEVSECISCEFSIHLKTNLTVRRKSHFNFNV